MSGHGGVISRITRAMFVLLAALAIAACGGGESESKAKGEVVITCATCQDSPTDTFLQSHYKMVQAFNAKYRGRYRVQIVNNQFAIPGPKRLQHYQRLALANDLPDVFILGRNELQSLQKTNKLLDFGPILEQERQWKDSFYAEGFAAVTDARGHVNAIPEQRDAIGFFYNKRLLQRAGVAEFPATWQELEAACGKIKASGKICFAMDGDWVTQLVWANLIGTQPGGADFLAAGIRDGDLAANAEVVRATEFLKRMHTQGYVNRDAFSGDYKNAATPFVRGEAAMIANGPWMVQYDIKAKGVPASVYDSAGYAPSPGWTPGAQGVMVLAGNAGWLSGARDERKKEAVTEFLKFVTSERQALEKTRKTGAYPPTKLDLERASLEPLAANLVKQSTTLPTYRHAAYATPADFATAWKNGWPAYVQGKLSTDEFLGQLSRAAKDGGT